MKCTHNLPVFNISNFYDYNKCMEFDKNFYVRTFKDHIQENGFIEKPHGHVIFFTKKYFMQDYTRSQLTKLPFFKSSLNVPYLKL